MRREPADTVEVAMRLAIAVAIAALGVLFFSGNAYPAERAMGARATASARDLQRAEETARTQTLLLSARPASPEEHAAQARQILRRVARARWTSVSYALVQMALSAATGLSPRGLVSGARRLYRAAWRPGSRRRAEEQALARIEPEILSGSTSEPLWELHAELQRGQRNRAAIRRLDLAERALERGELPLARRQLRDARSFAPSSRGANRTARRIDRLLEAREELWSIPAPTLLSHTRRAPTSADARRASQLLVGSALLADPSKAAGSPDALLASAVATYTAGEAESALGMLRRIAAEDSPAATVARRALSDPLLNVSDTLDRARSRRRMERALVWLGGRDLEAHGTRLSLAGIRAWKSALDPVNLVVGIPARVLRGDDAPEGELCRAAKRYLEVQRTGSRRLRVQALLDGLEIQAARRSERSAFLDGRLDLPRARTPYVPITARALGVERGLLESLDAESLGSPVLPDGARGAWLVPVPLADAMPREDARKLVLQLALDLEAGSARPLGAPKRELGERLRRLEAILDRGDAGLAIRPWSPPDRRTLAEIPRALAERGRRVPESSFSLERRRRELRVTRELGSSSHCPAGGVCLERARAFDSQAYATLADDGAVLLATRAQLGGLAVSLELEDALPRATLSIPLGHWLRAGSWLPAGERLGARFVIGLDGISLGPILPGPDATFDEALSQGS